MVEKIRATTSIIGSKLKNESSLKMQFSNNLQAVSSIELNKAHEANLSLYLKK